MDLPGSDNVIPLKVTPVSPVVYQSLPVQCLILSTTLTYSSIRPLSLSLPLFVPLLLQVIPLTPFTPYLHFSNTISDLITSSTMIKAFTSTSFRLSLFTRIFLIPLPYSHIVHHLLAKYAVGADSDVLNAAYDTDKVVQLPAYPSPGPITVDNWRDHLGNEDYYQAYFTFFAASLLEKGIAKSLEGYVYSKPANYDDQREKEGKEQPKMFSRFIGGIYHPIIHVGYGLEFGMLGIIAEGIHVLITFANVIINELH
jgi:Questin oxidase-like